MRNKEFCLRGLTILGCGSATGQIIPPFIIFAAKQVNPLWTANEVSGSRYAVRDGWTRSSSNSG